MNSRRWQPGLWLLLVGVLALTACDSFKKVQRTDESTEEKDELEEIQGNRKYNPETGQYEVVTEVTEKMDTIIWLNPPADVAPPIGSTATGSFSGDTSTTRLESYTIAITLPFLADRYDAANDQIDRRSVPALNFYEGAKIAFDALAEDGVNLTVNVLDTRAQEGTVSALTQDAGVRDAHLVIGTFRNQTARVMASFGQEREIPFVSPFYPHQNLVANNEHFIQVNPSEREHSEAIMRHAKNHFPDNRIVIFARNDAQERANVRYLMQAHFEVEGSTTADSIEVVFVDDADPTLKNVEWDLYLDEISTSAIVVASSSQSFVYQILRNLDLERDNRSVVVYGQPRWRDFNQIDYSYYETMNVHISSEMYVNPADPKVQAFEQSFFDRYGMPPTDEAYKGYDTMLYFGRMLQKFGTNFTKRLDQNAWDGLHTRFDFQRVVTRPIESREGNDLQGFDQYMNKYLNILEFSDYQFRKAD